MLELKLMLKLMRKLMLLKLKMLLLGAHLQLTRYKEEM